VLDSKRTATDGVGLVLALFVSSSESESVDEVHGGRSLTGGGDFGVELFHVVFSDGDDVFLEGGREGVAR
jgi:hypothetical protein